jgi:hypothetical protein
MLRAGHEAGPTTLHREILVLMCRPLDFSRERSTLRAMRMVGRVPGVRWAEL